MNTESDFIKINKVVTNRDSKVEIKPDTIRISDIKKFRNWEKRVNEKDVQGNMIVLSIKSSNESNKDAFFDIYIVEEEESFSKRVGGVVPLI